MNTVSDTSSDNDFIRNYKSLILIGNPATSARINNKTLIMDNDPDSSTAARRIQQRDCGRQHGDDVERWMCSSFTIQRYLHVLKHHEYISYQ